MSTLSVTNIKHGSSATNNIALDSSGNATFAGTVVTPSLNNGPLAGFRNAIINGNFDIWQRGTSFTSTSVNEYSVDRFRSEGFSLSTTISRQSFASNQTDVPGYPTYYCRVATSATVSGGQYWAFQQRVEAPQNLSGYEQVTLSFWARATSGSIAANTFSYGGSSGRLSNNPTLTTTWQKLTHTWIGSGPASGYVEVYLMYLAAGTSAISVDIAQVQLEAGPVATPFERRPIGTELALCQRYYEKSDGLQGSGFFFSGNVTSGQTYYAVKGFAVQKRAAPVVAFSSTVVNGFPSVAAASEIDKFGFRASAIANTTGSGGFFLGQWTASAEL